MAKTMKNANIRVSKINNTKEGQKIYEFEEIKLIIRAWQKEKEFEYFMIEHNEDIENIHYHLVLKFSSPTRFETIKNKFAYGNIENSKSLKNSIQYLIHKNSPEKFQYSEKDIITNSKDLNKYLLKSKVSEELDLNFYLSEIEKGNVKEYNYTEKIPIDMYSKNSAKIEKAFKYYYDRYMMNSDRKIEVEFYYGKGGTGKTTYAKTMCVLYNESYCISSSSNDPLQDYKGEDVLILDDLRDDVFKFDDLLKILDNNTNSSIKSRYRNRIFTGKRIIITSNIELSEWYKYKKMEDVHQFHRRIKTMLKFDNEDIYIWVYNNALKRYEYKMKRENIIAPAIEEEREKEEKEILKRFVL